MGIGSTKGEQAVLMEMVVAKHGTFYWLLKLPNGKWGVFWSSGLENEYCTELVYGNSDACTYVSECRADAENWIETERERMRKDNPAMAAAF